jgi:hypothetical protein
MCNGSIEDATLLLAMYEEWEKLALLEMVVWKCCCLADDRFDCMQDVADYSALDKTFDPVTYKQQARLGSAAGAILSCTRSFLQ